MSIASCVDDGPSRTGPRRCPVCVNHAVPCLSPTLSHHPVVTSGPSRPRPPCRTRPPLRRRSSTPSASLSRGSRFANSLADVGEHGRIRRRCGRPSCDLGQRVILSPDVSARAWPGPICSVCWAGCCVSCDRAIASWGEAGAVALSGRLLCRLCAPPGAALFDALLTSLLCGRCLARCDVPRGGGEPVAWGGLEPRGGDGRGRCGRGWPGWRSLGEIADPPDPLASVLDPLDVIQGYADYESRSSDQAASGTWRGRTTRCFAPAWRRRRPLLTLASLNSADDRARLVRCETSLYGY